MQPNSVKSISVYRNGDHFFEGRRFVVNHRQIRNFDSFLEVITQRLAPTFGAVRNLYTPRHGHRVCALDALAPGEKYVAAGIERFKKIDYMEIEDPLHQHSRLPRATYSKIRPVTHSRIHASARCKKHLTEHPCIVHLYRNGDELFSPVRLLLTKQELTSWDHLLQLVTYKVHLTGGAVRKLYRLDGSEVSGPTDLETGHFYVAAGFDRFKRVPYGVDRSLTAAILTRSERPKANRRARNNKYHRIPAKTADERPVVPDSKASKRPDMFHAKMGGKQKKRRDGYQVDYDKDDSGVYKSKSKSEATRGATEVPDDGDTVVDLPTDQVPAEEVSEEKQE